MDDIKKQLKRNYLIFGLVQFLSISSELNPVSARLNQHGTRWEDQCVSRNYTIQKKTIDSPFTNFVHKKIDPKFSFCEPG